MRFGTLRSRLLGSLICLSLGPLALVGLLAYRSAEQSLRQKAVNHLSTAAILKAEEITSWVSEKERDIRLLATLPGIRAAAGQLLADRRTGRRAGESRKHLRTALLQLPLTYPDIAEVFLLDARTGEVVLSTDPAQEGKLKDDRPYFREGRAGPFVQSVYYSLSLGRSTMTMATPVRDDSDRPVGVLVGRVNLARLDQVMAERTGLGTTGETFLVNRFNFFVSEVRGRDRLPEQAAVFTAGVKAALRGENGTALYRNHRGIPVIGAYRWLPGVSLALVAEIEQAEAFAPVAGLRRTLLGVGLLLIAVVLPVALWLGRSVTRPVAALVEGARALGTGDLAHRIPVAGPEELAFLAQAFNRMAEALEQGRDELEQANVTLEAKVQERTAELAALHSLAAAVSRSLDLGEILEVAADTVLAAFGAEGSLIRAVDPETGVLVALAARGVSGGFLAERRHVPREDPVPGLLLGLREPLVIADLAGDPRGAILRVTGEGYRSFAAVTLRGKDRVVGTLSAFARAPGRFGPRQGRLLAAMGVELATALEKAALFQQVRADAEFRKAAAELALTLSSTLKVDEVLSLTCLETARLFQVGGSYLWRVDEDRGELVGAAAHGHKADAFLGLRVPLAAPDSVAAAVAREGRPQVVHDVPASGIAHAFLARTFDGGSLLVVPLRVRDKVTGVLVLNDLHPSRRFSAADVHGAEVIAGQAALALENARLYSEVLAHAEVLEQRVIERTREVEEASRHKSEFLAHMSHELRTPLNAVIGFAQVLEQEMAGALNPKQRRYVANIHRSGKHLLTLINDILDLAKVEAGRLEFHFEDLSLPQLVDETMAIVKGMAASRGIKLELSLSEEVTTLPGDPVRLKQILFNLLSNAVKFTPPGGLVTLRTSLSSGGEEVLLAVSDTGIGIEPEDLKRLFRPFEQIDTGEAREFPGTGLGLSLTRRLVELHGGRIWAESPGPTQGSTFTLALPKRQAAPKLRILVVDDEARDRELVGDYLQAAGFAVGQAADGLEALERIARARPDLLVLDLGMPTMSGRELLQRLRDRAETSTLPVIVISGTEGMMEEERLALGVTAFLSKPFSPAVLLHTITGTVAAPTPR